jgi:hypothetical protein
MTKVLLAALFTPPCRLSLQAVNAAIFAMRGVRNAA